jgi:molybdenum cofactor biosynthesis protein B
LFRLLSFEAIGSSAMLSRAVAGIVRGTPVFLLPGSPEAVRLALTRLVLPEIAHVASELSRHGPRA